MADSAPTVASVAGLDLSGQPHSFAFEAQTPDGQRISGKIDAANAEKASRQIALLRLRLIRLGPADDGDGDLAPSVESASVEASRPGRASRALRGSDFIAFNQQLGQLAKAGLPIESGLRLIAKDMRSGRLAQTIKAVADELDRGVPIGQAFEKYRGRFPSLYGRLLDAGVASGDLSGVLLGFGAHLEMLQRLRSALWRAVSYPLAVLAALAILLIFLGKYVLPRFQELYAQMAPQYLVALVSWPARLPPPELPLPTRILFAASQVVPYIAGVVLAGILLGPIFWQLLRLGRWDVFVTDAVVLRLPLVGRPIRLNLIARWCDAMRIGVSAGLPLPAAMKLASDAVRSPRLRHDGEQLLLRLEKGLSFADVGSRLSLLPATVPVSIELASGHNDLPTTLRSLAELYERQADARVNAIPAVLTPVMVIAAALLVGFVIGALILPLHGLLDKFIVPGS